MKRVLIVITLAAVLATGTAFADHPKLFGIGIQGNWYTGWDHGGQAEYALSLKLPIISIFWAGVVRTGDGYLTVGINGDKYIFDASLVPDINLHWFLGLGGWGNLVITDDNLGLALGARLPIGLSWHPVDMLELYLAIAPSLGVRVTPDFDFPVGGYPVELGLRLWF